LATGSRDYAFNHLNVPSSLLRGSGNEMVLVRAAQGNCEGAEGAAPSETLAAQGERLWRTERDRASAMKIQAAVLHGLVQMWWYGMEA
jgi:hypothetical protein